MRELPHPVALAGGHAVRHVVRDAWERRFGEEYFGSRDIGFERDGMYSSVHQERIIRGLSLRSQDIQRDARFPAPHPRRVKEGPPCRHMPTAA